MLLLPGIEPRFLGRPGQIFCYFGHIYEIFSDREFVFFESEKTFEII